MKRITGAKLLSALRDMRDRRADVILSMTGYLGRDANLRKKSDETIEFLNEFYWSYVEANGFPVKKEGDDYYAQAPNMVSPTEYILPPSLVAYRYFRRFEHALRTGHISFKVKRGQIHISKYIGAVPESQAGKSVLEENPNLRLEGVSLLEMIEKLRVDMPTNEIVFRTGHDSLRSFRLAQAKALGVSKSGEERTDGTQSFTAKPSDNISIGSITDVGTGYKKDDIAEQTVSQANQVKGRDVKPSSRVFDLSKKKGIDLLEFACDQYSEGIAETSICIRSGYETDAIGQFRRAFARAAGVNLAPLARMISEYSKELNPPNMLVNNRKLISATFQYRSRSSTFRDSVISLHGAQCQVCGMEICELIEAAHIVPVASNGIDHPSNGIPLCPTHHSAFDRYLFAFEPVSKLIIIRSGFDASVLGITKTNLLANVSDEALRIRHALFNNSNQG